VAQAYGKFFDGMIEERPRQHGAVGTLVVDADDMVLSARGYGSPVLYRAAGVEIAHRAVWELFFEVGTDQTDLLDITRAIDVGNPAAGRCTTVVGRLET
jgi:hypothetical protein